MPLYDDMLYPPGYPPREEPDSQRIDNKRVELEKLRDKMVLAKDLIKSDYWKAQIEIWQGRIKSIVGQYDPTSTTALSDAVFGMGMMRQIYDDMGRPQDIIDLYEKKKDSYDKLVRSQRPK